MAHPVVDEGCVGEAIVKKYVPPSPMYLRWMRKQKLFTRKPASSASFV